MNLGYEVVPTRKTAATGQFEIVDGNHPDWRGQRFSDRERAERELAQAVGEPGRFYIKDRSEKKSAAADSTYGDDWDDGDWTNYGAGFDQGAAGHPLGHDTGDDGSGHGQPFKDGHYDGSMTNARSFRSASKTAGDFDSKDCMFCGGKLAFTGSGPKDNDWGGYEHRCLSCGQAQMRDKKVGSLTFTAKEVGYYVCSRNGVPISGPYATRSDAAPNMIEQRGATVMFIGPGNSAEWDALKAKTFPVGTNTVNGSKRTAADVNYGGGPGSGDPGIDMNYADSDHEGKSDRLGTDATCDTCGKVIIFDGFHGPMEKDEYGNRQRGKSWRHVVRAAKAEYTAHCGSDELHGAHMAGNGFCVGNKGERIVEKQSSWETEEDPWAGQHTAEWATYDTVGGDPVGPKCEACGGTPTRKNDGVNLCSDCDRRYSEHPLTAASDAAALVCMECNKKFKRKVGPGSTPKCPGCGGYDVEPDYQGGFPLHGSMQERYATGQRLATLRHFAEDDEEGPEEDEWFKQPKGLTDQVDTGLAPASEIQDPNPLAGQDLERIPRNLAEAALWAQAGDGLDPYDERHWLDHGTEGTDFNPEDYPEDTPHDQLDDPWNGQENPLGRGWGDPPLGY